MRRVGEAMLEAPGARDKARGLLRRGTNAFHISASRLRSWCLPHQMQMNAVSYSVVRVPASF